ncbi:AAA family ATPase [Alcaligenaceae bacterium]|nr:AAA family ATPase [Alcaligenaceae bacterium]
MEKLPLTLHQQAAYDSLRNFALSEDGGIATLEGYAGTGKTFLIGRLLNELIDNGHFTSTQLAIAAPTNKAVAVLASKTREDVPASSIHSLLGLKLKELEDGGQTCVKDGDSSLHNYSVVVVDECSMVSIEIFKNIIYSRRTTKIIFVGDPAQLPPVGEAQISPTFTAVDKRFMLSEVVRQAADNPIIKMSMVIRKAIEEQRRAMGGRSGLRPSMRCSSVGWPVAA